MIRMTSSKSFTTKTRPKKFGNMKNVRSQKLMIESYHGEQMKDIFGNTDDFFYKTKSTKADTAGKKL